jgi:hypothetical protein
VSRYKDELEYLDLLEINVKYKYDINQQIELDDNKQVNINNLNTNKIRYNLLIYCIRKKLNYSSKILIKNQIDTDILYEKKTLLYHCIDYQNHIIFANIVETNKKLINKNLNNVNIITYLFANIKNFTTENILMRFLIKIFVNQHTSFQINQHDLHNKHIGYLILDSSLTNNNKLLLFNIIKKQIDPLVINKNIPLILYSTLLNEYEITYLLLGNLIMNKKVKKNINTNSIFDYEHDNKNININFIPVIFKFIKDSSQKYPELKDTNITYELEDDKYIDNIFVMILQIIIYIYYFYTTNTCIKTDKTNIVDELYKDNNINFYINKKLHEKNNIDNISNSETDNKYLEITIGSEISGITTDNIIENVIINKKKRTNNSSNKNIWKNTGNFLNDNLSIIKKEDYQNKYISEVTNTNSSNNLISSELEESEICFN